MRPLVDALFLLLPILWASAGPWLAGATIAPLHRLAIAGIGLAVALVTRVGGGAEELDAGARTLRERRLLLGLLGASLVVLLTERAVGLPRAAALGLVLVGLLALLAFVLDLARLRDRGPSLGVVLSSVAMWLFVGAAALAGARLASGSIGRAERAGELLARDLCAIAAAEVRGGREVDAIAASLMPDHGLLVKVDPAGRVLAGTGAAEGSVVEYEVHPLERCGTDGQKLPCAERLLASGDRLLCAAPPDGLPLLPIVGWLLATLALLACALPAAPQLGRHVERDLQDYVRYLDDPGAGSSAFARPIERGATEELDRLAAALEAYRQSVRPLLADYAEALEKAQAADNERTRFLDLVSAELRTPLDLIMRSAETLLDADSEPLQPEQQEDVRIVISACKHLHELIDEVLDLSAVASGSVTLRRARFNLVELAGELGQAQRPLLQHKGVELRLRMPPAPIEVDADPRRIRQVLSNLLSNAAKFTTKGFVEVAVEVDATRGRAAVAVTDTGPGIAADELPRLFNEFSQVGSVKQRALGTGLGLAICKRLVEAHGGTIEVRSQPGKGSTFTLSLPLQAVARPPGPEVA